MFQFGRKAVKTAQDIAALPTSEPLLQSSAPVPLSQVKGLKMVRRAQHHIAERGEYVIAFAGSLVVAKDGAEVIAMPETKVAALKGSVVTALPGSQVIALAGSKVFLRAGAAVKREEGTLLELIDDIPLIQPLNVLLKCSLSLADKPVA